MAIKRKYIYLINPISGTRGKSALLSLIKKKTSEAAIDFEILPTVADGNYDFVKYKIEQEGVTDIIICGGDGSVNKVVQSLANVPVNFGIIPMGSGNGLALSAGIPTNSVAALEVAFKGKPKRVDAFLVNDQFACMLCGLGFDARVAHEFAQQPKRGLGTYASLTTKNFLSAKPYQFQILANKLNFSTEAFFISIANSNQFGNNFTIAPKAVLSDGLLDIVIVKKMAKPLLLVSVLKQVLAGRLNKLENSMNSPVIYFQTEEISIKNSDLAPLHIDGEPIETSGELKIKVLKNYFKLIHGR